MQANNSIRGLISKAEEKSLPMVPGPAPGLGVAGDPPAEEPLPGRFGWRRPHKRRRDQQLGIDFIERVQDRVSLTKG